MEPPKVRDAGLLDDHNRCNCLASSRLWNGRGWCLRCSLPYYKAEYGLCKCSMSEASFRPSGWCARCKLPYREKVEVDGEKPPPAFGPRKTLCECDLRARQWNGFGKCLTCGYGYERQGDRGTPEPTPAWPIDPVSGMGLPRTAPELTALIAPVTDPTTVSIAWRAWLAGWLHAKGKTMEDLKLAWAGFGGENELKEAFWIWYEAESKETR